jgi:hypothetical protein
MAARIVLASVRGLLFMIFADTGFDLQLMPIQEVQDSLLLGSHETSPMHHMDRQARTVDTVLVS